MAGENLKQIRIGELLIQEGRLTQLQLDEALAFQKGSSTREKIGDVLINRGYVSEDDFLDVLHRKLGVPVMDLSRFRVNTGACALVPQTIAQKYLALPVEFDEFSITVAMQNPADYYAIEEIEMVSKRKVRPAIAKRSSIQIGIERAYAGAISMNVIDNANREREYTATDFSILDEEATDRINNAPIVQLVDAILNQAMKMRASDIHIEPIAERVRVRFRVDGELLEIMTLNPSVHTGLVTRVKIMANMDIAEKRLPQDGRFTSITANSEVHTRVATMPTLYGEKIVIRLLGDSSAEVPDVSALGMNLWNKNQFMRLLQAPSGIVLLAGPTGSGKTTTLYSAMKQLAKPTLNVVSVEDPIEKAIDGMNQMQINVKAGNTFASSLRALLRQDPDVIMIGEIRDPETAQIAARAAITGHLVLSTIHTNDAASTVARIVDMGVESYITASALQGVVSQRLVRILCPHCKLPLVAGAEEHSQVPEIEEGETIYQAVGCIHCNNTGYQGRTAVHEILIVNSQMRAMIARGSTTDELRQCSLEGGARPLRQNMVDLVCSGNSSISELLRVTFSLD